MSVEHLITEHLDIWTSAIQTKSAAGRGSSKKLELVGIKKLRELILELAVRGKLVPQDPNDEPACELLKKIEAEKTRLVKEGKIKKQKPLPPILEENLFDLPDGWDLCQIGNFAEIKGGKRLPKGHSLCSEKTAHAYIRVTDMKGGSVKLNGLQYLTSETHNLIKQYIISKKDLYITIAGTIGEVGTIPDELDGMNLTENAAKIVFDQINRDWLKKALSSSFIQNQFMDKVNQLAQPKLALHRILSSAVALPPLAEQHRIVAKVDELMVLCDQLEAQTESSIQAHQLLVETLLATLTSAKDADDLSESWERISQHFDVLFTTQDSIDQLKQTILQLAVMGKLVKQDPANEPAAKLLERIATEKKRLVRDGKIKKQKPVPQVNDDEKPFELPLGWVWAKLGQIAILENGDRSKRYPNESDLVSDGVPFFGAKDMVDGALQFSDELRFITSQKFEELSNGKLQDKDYVILLRGYVGKLAQFRAKERFSTGFINAQMLIIRLLDLSLCKYFGIFSSSIIFQSSVSKKVTGSAVSQMPASEVLHFCVAIPPEKEQCRIVAKVDELMALCNLLKVNLEQAQISQLKLTRTLVKEAL